MLQRSAQAERIDMQAQTAKSETISVRVLFFFFSGVRRVSCKRVVDGSSVVYSILFGAMAVGFDQAYSSEDECVSHCLK